MKRLDLFSEIGKQYFIYSTNINEIASLSKNINKIYTFQFKESTFFGFFDNLSLETLVKAKDINFAASSGKDVHDKLVSIQIENSTVSVCIENLFSPSISVDSSNEKPSEKLDIQVNFSEIDSVTHECVLVPTKSLIKSALNLSHYKLDSIIHSPLTIDNEEYSFMRYYNFLFNMKDVINLSKQHDYYIDVKYKANQKIFFQKRDATYIILPSINKIVRFNEYPRFLREIIKIKKETSTKLIGLNTSVFFTERVSFKEELEKYETKETVVKQISSKEMLEVNTTPVSVKKKANKNKVTSKNIDSIIREENKEYTIINVFSSGGVTSKSKIEALIDYSISTKNHPLFIWACLRYIIFHPKHARQKEKYLTENYKTVFERALVNAAFGQRIFDHNPNIFTRFINKSRKTLVNKDILKFTKDKEGLISSIPNNKLNESDYPKEIIASLYSGGNNINSSNYSDNEINKTVEVLKSKTKKLSNIHGMIDHFADYARYLNGKEASKKNIDFASTVFADHSKLNTETDYAHAIAILLNCAKQSGYGFSYTQAFELGVKLEELTRKVFSEQSNKVLNRIVTEYTASAFSSWFKTNRKVSFETIINDESFMNSLNSASQFSMHELIASITKKIDDQSFVFKKNSIIEVTTAKILSCNAASAARSFAEYLSKDIDGNSNSISLLRFNRKAQLLILSDFFDLNFLDNTKMFSDFVVLLIDALKQNSDAIKQYYSFMMQSNRYMKDESKTRFYRELTENFISYFITSNNDRDKSNIINCMVESISGTIMSDKPDTSIKYLSEVLAILNDEEKAILLNKVAKKAYVASDDFKEHFINECISLISEFEKKRDTKERVIAYYAILETVFSIYVKDSTEEESCRDIFFAKEEDAYRKRINEIEYFVNSDEFSNSNFDETSIQDIL